MATYRIERTRDGPLLPLSATMALFNAGVGFAESSRLVRELDAKALALLEGSKLEPEQLAMERQRLASAGVIVSMVQAS